MNNKRAIYESSIFEFFIFLFSNIAILAYFDPKLPFLSLKLLLNYFYIKNIDEITLRQVGPEMSKTSLFLPFLCAQKSSHTQTFKYMSRIQFSL